MQGVVKKRGSGAAVLDAAHVRLDQPVDVREEGGRIVIEPLHPMRYDINTLVACITDENRHDPVGMGPPVGREAWCACPTSPSSLTSTIRQPPRSGIALRNSASSRPP